MWLLQPFLRCAKNEEDEAREPHLGVDPISLLAAQEAWICFFGFVIVFILYHQIHHHQTNIIWYNFYYFLFGHFFQALSILFHAKSQGIH